MAERDAVEKLLFDEWRALVDEAAVRPERSPLALPPERRMPLSRTALLALLAEVRASWSGLRERVDPELGERFVNAAWTLKDLLAHLSSWAAEFRREVEGASRGESFDYAIPYAMAVIGPNAWNEEQVAARRDRDLEQIFEEFESETARLEELVIEMSERELYGPSTFPLAPSGDPSSRWRGPAAILISGKCLHDRYHIAQIKERLRRFRS